MNYLIMDNADIIHWVRA